MPASGSSAMPADPRLLFALGALPAAWAMFCAIADLFSVVALGTATASEGVGYAPTSTSTSTDPQSEPLLQASTTATIPTRQEQSPFVTLLHPSKGRRLNPRWKILDSSISVLLVIQCLVSFFALGSIVAGVGEKENDFKFIDAVVEGFWSFTWLVSLGWLNLIVTRFPRDSHLGRGFLALYILSLLSRFFQTRIQSESEQPPSSPIDRIDMFYILLPVISGTILVPILTLEIVQRYWQATILPRIRNTTGRKQRAAMGLGANATTIDVDEDDKFGSNESLGGDHHDNPDDESSSRFVREKSREHEATWFSRITFSWIDPLMFRGYQIPLESEEVWDVAEEDKTGNVLERYLPIKKTSKSLFFALTTFFKWRIIGVILGAALNCALGFASPFFLYRIVSFLNKPPTTRNPNEGYMLLLGLLFALLCRSCLEGGLFYEARRTAIRVRSTLVSEIYGKALRRAAGVVKTKEGGPGFFDRPEQKANMGKIVSLMSSDASRIYAFSSFAHMPLVAMPMSAIISTTALFYLLGPSALAGLTMIMLTGPLTTLIGTYMIKEQLALATATDSRTQVMNETLQGIRIIKYFAWEEEFAKKIIEARENELNKIRRLWGYYLGFFTTAFGGSVLVTFVSFFFYCVVAGHKLDAATAFTSLNLLHLVSGSLNALPMIGMQVMRTKVALDRIADFLDEDELEKYDGESIKFSEKAKAAKEAKQAKSRKSNVNETTPLLASEGSSSSAVVNVDEEEKVVLPNGFIRPLIGFFKGEFIYYGSENAVKNAKAAGAAGGVVESGATSVAGTPDISGRGGSGSGGGKGGKLSKLIGPIKSIFAKKKAAVGGGEGGDAKKPTGATQQQQSDDQVPFELRNLTLEIPESKLTVVVGPTGSGKTSLLLSLLGEMKRIKGFGFFPDPRLMNPSVAYVAQSAFLLNASIRENILFGRAFDDRRYREVVEACALVRDLEILEGGDLTEIGEKGVNLSGGQKQRISLARAAYSPASIILLDDCLSAVDAPTARHLLRKCILGPLMTGRTRILVTHAANLVLPHADYVVAMKNGEIEGCGTLREVLDNPQLDIGPMQREDIKDDIETAVPTTSEGKAASEKAKMEKDAKTLKGISKKGTKIVSDEERSRGSVKFSVYLTYFAAMGGIAIFGLYLLGYILNYMMNFAGDYWVKVWSDSAGPAKSMAVFSQQHSLREQSISSISSVAMTLIALPPIASLGQTISPISNFAALYPAVANATSEAMYTTSNFYATNSTVPPQDGVEFSPLYFIGIYALITFSSLAFGMVVQLVGFYLYLVASRSLHNRLLNSILGAPMKFFEKTPVGRLLNRFTKDISSIDTECGDTIADFVRLIVQFIVNLVIIGSVAPSSFMMIPIVFFCYYWVATMYLSTSRELKRLESVSNSPIYAQFSETLMGVSTIRAYGAEQRFIKIVDRNNRNTFYLWTANRWLNLRCEWLSAFFSTFVGFSIVSSGISAGWAGLTLTYAFEITSALTYIIRNHANMDMAMNSVERVEEYISIEQEPPAIVENYRPPEGWPSKGAIQVKDLTVRYGVDQPAVLKGLTFDVRAGEKIGVVGRTGAGKSTLTLAFFRILENIEGSAVIDGVDLFKLGVRDLRSRLTIIPQDPVLFEGTIRFNLDPVGKHTDEQLWDAVKAVGLLESMQTRSASSSNLLALAANAAAAASSSSSAPAGGASLEIQDVGDVNKPATPAEGATSSLTLDSAVTESGNNFSQGQRQLICMARALLRNTKVFFLDEATASVDEAADTHIQKTIRNAFKDGTVITIAHRLKTIIDYDRVLVLDHGEIVEFDEPYRLLHEHQERGMFKRMCEESGEYQELVAAAKSKHHLKP
ncbi:hypothetical protein HDU76_012496 [Blyttiomyces sp. JEL0837]|nr:hypothetical protein HDU76_012496 [Blyttiomyces sp. JEL0837]